MICLMLVLELELQGKKKKKNYKAEPLIPNPPRSGLARGGGLGNSRNAPTLAPCVTVPVGRAHLLSHHRYFTTGIASEFQLQGHFP